MPIFDFWKVKKISSIQSEKKNGLGSNCFFVIFKMVETFFFFYFFSEFVFIASNLYPDYGFWEKKRLFQ
jgi:hypothetical protein